MKQVSVNLLGHVVIRSILLRSQGGRRVLGMTHLSTGFSLLPLLGNGIAVDDIRLFKFAIGLGQRAPRSTPGFRFILSTFTSGSAIGAGSGLSLQVGSILVEHNEIACSVLSRPRAPNGFGTRRLSIGGLTTALSLGTLHDSSLGTTVQQIDFSRRYNFSLRGFTVGIATGGGHLSVGSFKIRLSGATLGVSDLALGCSDLPRLPRVARGVECSNSLGTSIVLGSLTPFIPTLSHFRRPLSLGLIFSNRNGRLSYPALQLAGRRKLVVTKRTTLDG